MNKKIIIFLTTLFLIFLAIFIILRYTKHNNPPIIKQSPLIKSMNITSSAFQNNQHIPAKYTCTGEGINPPLEFSEIPENTKSLALIVDDPDAPMGTWVHWVVYNINPEVREIKENSAPLEALLGLTSSGNAKYGPPCPPSGTHRYFFKLYALNKMLDLTGEVTKQTIEEAMKNSIISQAQIIGLYSK